MLSRRVQAEVVSRVEADHPGGNRLFVASDRAVVTLPHSPPWRLIWRIVLTEFLVVSSAAYLASAIYHKIVFDVAPPAQQNVASSLLVALLFLLVASADDQYNLVNEKWARRGISRGVGAVALAFVFFLSFNFLFKIADDYSRGTFLLQIVMVFPALLVTRTLLTLQVERAIAAGRLQGRRLVVVSLIKGGQHTALAKRLGETPDKIIRWYNSAVDFPGFHGSNVTAAFRDRLSALRDECRKNGADTVIIVFNTADLPQIGGIIETFYELPANIQLLPVDLVPYMYRSRVTESGRVHVLEISSRSTLFERALKRGIDLAVATIAVVALIPVFVLVSIAIKLDSRGPLLFRQIRHGFNNEPIEVLKFRTMVSSDDTKFQQTARNDPRITWVGYLLRRSNIDELPQLINVIRGDMSLVGPRPHAVEHNDAYAREIKLLNRRHSVKPGITGWAQVNGLRGATDTYEKMRQRIEYDLYYVDNWSFFFDVRILLMTLFSRNAYRNAY